MSIRVAVIASRDAARAGGVHVCDTYHVYMNSLYHSFTCIRIQECPKYPVSCDTANVKYPKVSVYPCVTRHRCHAPSRRSCPPAGGGGGQAATHWAACCPPPARDSALWRAPTPIRPLSTPHVMWAALGQRLHASYQPFHHCVERIPNPIRNTSMRSRRAVWVLRVP
jgi:hypothetical protein